MFFHFPFLYTTVCISFQIYKLSISNNLAKKGANFNTSGQRYISFSGIASRGWGYGNLSKAEDRLWKDKGNLKSTEVRLTGL